MDRQQCEAVIEYLESCRTYAKESGRIEELSRVVDWWQSIYEEKAGSI